MPAAHWNVKHVEWVVKISKLCNLRCAYCYEFPFLAERARMGLDDLRRMFRHVAEFYADSGKRMDFVWHGGEPLLVEPSYYEAIVAAQHEILGAAAIEYTNSVQTNLTVLNTEILALLKSGMFSNIGVSVDLYGGQRVNVAGRSSQELVLANMQRLIDEGVGFGCITVLSQATKLHVESVYRFFEEIGTSFRLLPIYRTGFPGQQNGMALSTDEIVEAFKRVVDLWLSSHSDIQVRPIQDYVTHVVGRMSVGSGGAYYDKVVDEAVYIVEPDGALYSVADPPDVSLCHGNIFSTPLFALKNSAGYMKAVAAAHGRMADACTPCQYHGICSGYFVGEATPEQRTLDAEGHLRCGVAKPVQEYIEQRLVASGWPATGPR